MSLDEKTLNKIKKEIRKGDETLPDILKKLPDILPEKFERKPKLSPEQRKELQGLLEKYKEKKKIIPKVKPEPDRKDKKFKDFFKRIDPKDFIDPELKKKRREDFFKKFNPGDKKKFYENMPYRIDPDNPMPRMEPAKPYIIKPKDKNNPSIVQLLKKGGTVKGYKAGGEVKTDKSPNSGMITKRGWGKSRKT
jgi:hypothetical protein